MDCGVQTEVHNIWTMDHGLGIKHGLRYKTRTVYKVMSTDCKGTQNLAFH